MDVSVWLMLPPLWPIRGSGYVRRTTILLSWRGRDHREPGDAAHDGTRGARSAHFRVGADHGRDGLRERDRGPRDSPLLSALLQTVGGYQLRCAAGATDGERAVRSRAGRFQRGRYGEAG